MSEQESHSRDELDRELDLANIAKLPLRDVAQLVEENKRPVRDGGWWEGVRELAVGRMQNTSLGAEERIEWGRTAVSAIQIKADKVELDEKARMASEAQVRAYVIREFGSSDADSFRNPRGLCEDVLSAISIEHDALAENAAKWREFPREEILQMRRVKNMLTPLQDVKHLLASDYAEATVMPWLRLLPILP